MSESCIITLANNARLYRKGQDRLLQSLVNNFDGDVLAFTSEDQVGAPRHDENPYAFKPYCFYEALKQGYKQVLWLDSSVWAVSNLQPIFDILQNEGYFMLDSGFYIKDWINDGCLNYFNLKIEQLITHKLFLAGLFGLNCNHPKSREFLLKWKNAADSGAFIGSWQNHRHDMTCGSVIANKLGMKYLQAEYYSSYIGSEYQAPNETSYFHLQGM